MRLSEKTIVVTGAGGGIGSALVHALLSEGANVAAVDINQHALDALAVSVGENSGRVSTHKADITDITQVETLLKEVTESHGTVDGLINNAGIIQPFVPVSELTFDQARRVMDINFMGTLNMVKTFLPTLLTRREAHIANVSSMGGFLPVPGQSVYGASKAAVKLLTEALYSELLDTSVGVSVIFPGAVETGITTNSGVKIKNMEDKHARYSMLKPDKAARMILKGIRTNRFRILVGRDAGLMDFLYRIAPRMATKLIANKLKDL